MDFVGKVDISDALLYGHSLSVPEGRREDKPQICLLVHAIVQGIRPTRILQLPFDAILDGEFAHCCV
jgi:hypothetical protein